MERILCAAIHYTLYPGCFKKIAHPVKNNDKWPGMVLCGYRHSNIISQFYGLTFKSTGPSDEQGFLTSEGRFVDRKEGWRIAYNAGQLRYKSGGPVELYSEDLY